MRRAQIMWPAAAVLLLAIGMAACGGSGEGHRAVSPSGGSGVRSRTVALTGRIYFVTTSGVMTADPARGRCRPVGFVERSVGPATVRIVRDRAMRRIAATFAWGATTIAVSPDRRRLAVLRDRAVTIYDVTSGRRLRAFVPHPPLGQMDEPAWAPDGRRLAVTLVPTAQTGWWGRGLGIVDVATGSARILVDDTAQSNHPWSTSPQWSPDGRWISYLAEFRDGPKRVIVVRPSGAARHAVTSPVLHPNLHAVWSPNSRMLAFEMSGPSSLELWSAGVSKPFARRLRSTKWPQPGFDSMSVPLAWSPDGSAILVADSGRAQGDVSVVRADGGGTRRLCHVERAGIGLAAWTR